jgi:antitoxin component of RelBE/YafQ-DinJ toxin-antitoxin module
MKDINLVVRVSQEMKEELHQLSNVHGLTVSSFVRMTLLKAIRDGKNEIQSRRIEE